MENSGKSRENKIVKVSIIGIITNILLVIVKAIIGVIAKSTAVILDAVNNLADAFSSIVTIVGTKLANKKPTKKHPYGYGRIEHLTSIVVAVIASPLSVYDTTASCLFERAATFAYKALSSAIVIAFGSL